MADVSKLSDILSCPVCYENFRPGIKILQCTAGHAMCEQCHGKLRECPVCKEVLIGTRNFVMEEVVKKLRRLSTGALMQLDDEIPAVDEQNNQLDVPLLSKSGTSTSVSDHTHDAEMKEEPKKKRKNRKKKSSKKGKSDVVGEASTFSTTITDTSGTTCDLTASSSNLESPPIQNNARPSTAKGKKSKKALLTPEEIKAEKKLLRDRLKLGTPCQPKGFFPCPMHGCNTKIVFCRLYNHIRSFHMKQFVQTEALLEENNLIARCDLEIKVPVMNYEHLIHVKEFGLFALVFSAEKEESVEVTNINQVTAYVKKIGTVSDGKNLTYSLEIGIGKYLATSSDMCHHSFTDHKELVSKEQVMILKVSKLSRFARIKVELKKTTGSRTRQPIEPNVRIIPNFVSTNHQEVQPMSANRPKSSKKKNKK